MKQVKEEQIKEKVCGTCSKMKPIKEYTIHLYSKDGYCINCKSCSRVQNNSKREMCYSLR